MGWIFEPDKLNYTTISSANFICAQHKFFNIQVEWGRTKDLREESVQRDAIETQRFALGWVGMPQRAAWSSNE